MEFRLLGLGQHVEPQPHLPAVREPRNLRRVAVDRELERRLHLQLGVLPRRRLEVDHDQMPVAIALEHVHDHDQLGLEHLARLLVDQRHGQPPLDLDDLHGRVLGRVEDREHPRALVEQLGLRALPEPHRAEARLEVPVGREHALHLGKARRGARLDATKVMGSRAVDRPAEDERSRDPLRVDPVDVGEPILERAADVLVELAEADDGRTHGLGHGNLQTHGGAGSSPLPAPPVSPRRS